MSSELIQARAKLAQIRTLLRQQKLLAAVIALHDSLAILMRAQLMKQEREEFTALIDNAIAYLSHDANLRKVYPLQMKYVPGQEKDLLAEIKDLLAALEEQERMAAEAQLKSLPKIDPLELGRQYLTDGNVDGAMKTFAEAAASDPALKGVIGELLLDYKHYAHAYSYLAEALENDPNAYHLYNKIGISLRKLKRYDVAEKYYLKALTYKKDDANLLFNFGRLYIDWGKWDKGAKLAQFALKCQPNFESAQKMLAFARKKMEDAGQ